MEAKKGYKAALAIFGLLLLAAAIVVIGGTITACGSGTTSKTTDGPVSSHSATTTTTSTDGTTWKMVEKDYGDNRWFTNGITEIKKAKTKAQAEAAALVWLDRVKRDPNLLVGAAAYFLDKNVKKASLSDKDNMATDKAVVLVSELQIAIASAKVAPDYAPSNGTNSGVANGMVVGARSSGITGNRKAVRITLAKGKTIWVMARCGNPVTMGRPPVPSGPTDQRRPRHPRHPRLQPKDWRQDPAAQGNAPIGGGQNQDSGPGVYVKPSDMVHPGPTPYTPPPPPPPPPPPTPTAPPAGSTPDPATPPPPEPGAPTPDDPGGPAPPIPGG